MQPTLLAATAIALATLLALLLAALLRVHRRNKYYRKVQRALDEEEAAFQSTLARNFADDPQLQLDDGDKAKLQMLESYMAETDKAAATDAHAPGMLPADDAPLPTRVEDVDKFMNDLAAAAGELPDANRSEP